MEEDSRLHSGSRAVREGKGKSMGGSLVGQLGFGHAEEPLRQREQMPQNCPFKEGVGNQGYLAPHPLP